MIVDVVDWTIVDQCGLSWTSVDFRGHHLADCPHWSTKVHNCPYSVLQNLPRPQKSTKKKLEQELSRPYIIVHD